MDLGKGLGFWNTMPIRPRRSTGSTSPDSRSSSPNSTRPSTRAPGTRSFMRLRHRRAVDLPQPDGPMSAVMAFLGTSIVTPLTAWCLPYHTPMSCRRKMGGPSEGSEEVALGWAPDAGCDAPPSAAPAERWISIGESLAVFSGSTLVVISPTSACCIGCEE